ncbi:MAG: hypothetical protein DWQ47_03750 [Acidobacteria bacterium]|nr:MAG: hypothetical protein DWQ32_07300 [Acidobacteriota bacterium]REK01511.1 MAG: hypothetical protein DWQ38_03735 [Acidobacteriota bacterium]REK14467.1 MAG: hypothetical protein DWQ43_12990 [Acidobacteriota bacterium]REK45182.1 MAG: hypothetical protein DWQ47_03750 [Acidobacteriota bacterium]
MNTNIALGAVIGLIVGLVAGFLTANYLNRSEIQASQTALANLRQAGSAGQSPGSGMELTDAEIRAKLKEADDNPENFQFQKTLGLALYSYAAMKQDATLLKDVGRLLERAHNLNPEDYEVLVSFGNITFDLGQIQKQEDLNIKSREIYQKALEKNTRDANVKTSYGVSFLATANPEPQKAIEQLSAATEIDPTNEKALRYLTRAYTEAGDNAKASETLSRLKEVNPQNPSISDLESKISSN